MAANSLTLTWVASATGTPPITFQPQFRVTGSTTWTSFGSPISATTVTISGLQASTSYDVEVLALNAGGNAASAVVTSATNSANAFPAPGNISGSQNSGSATPIIVGPQNGAATTSTALAVTGTTLTDVGATSGTLVVSSSSGRVAMTLSAVLVPGSGTKQITVADTFARCQTAIGTLVYTAPAAPTVDTIAITFTDQAGLKNALLIQIQVTAPPLTVPPAAPTNVVASAPTNATMQLTWNASATGSPPVLYQPQFKLHTASTYTSFGNPISALTAVVTGLSSGLSYDFDVIASNAAGSATSAVVTAATTSATIAPTAPTNLQVTAASNSTLTFSWSPGASGTPPVTFQPQYRQTGAPKLTNWFDAPGQDGGFWRSPFFNTAQFDMTSAQRNAIVNGVPAGNPGVCNVGRGGFGQAEWQRGRAADPLINVSNGTRSINVRIPLGAKVWGPGPSGPMGGCDETQPYLIWAVGGNGTIHNPDINGGVAANSNITCTFNFCVDDGSGQMMTDAVTGQPGTNNCMGAIQDWELTSANADPNYVIPHTLVYLLGTNQCGPGTLGVAWPLLAADQTQTFTGPVKQGQTLGIPASTPRPANKTRGWYLLFDTFRQFGTFFYNVGGTAATSMTCYSATVANDALAADVAASFPDVLTYCGILTNQTGPTSIKGNASGAVPAFPLPPPLDVSPTGGRTVAPTSFGAWFPSQNPPLGNNGTGFNVTPPSTQAQGTGAFINFGSPISGTSVTVSGLQANTSYDLQVIAINSVGQATSAPVTSATGATGIPSDTIGIQAKPAQDLLTRFGVNTHFGNGLYQAYTPAQAIAALQYLGCTLVRDSENG